MKSILPGLLFILFSAIMPASSMAVQEHSQNAIIKISSSNAGERFPAVFKGLLPGRTFEVILTLVNKYLNDLTIEKLSPSCGCLLPSNISKEFKAGASKDIQLKFNPGNVSGPQKRELKITDSQSRVWTVDFSFGIDSPIDVVTNILRFSGKSGKPETFFFEFSLKSGYEDIADFYSSNIEARAVGPVVQEVVISRGKDRNFWKVKVEASPKYMGGNKNHVENVVISSKLFEAAVLVKFQLDLPFRHSPTSLSTLQLKEGTQKLILFHDTESVEISLRALDKEGKHVPLSADVVVASAKVKVFKLHSDDADHIASIEVTFNGGKDNVPVTIPVSD